MSEWRYVKPLANESVIDETESKLGFKFCNSYIAFVKKYNGGRPPVGVFNTTITKERTIKSFLSLNITDTENIIVANQYVSEMRNDVIAFAVDSFGNYICFHKPGGVVFLNFETGDIEQISDHFDDFLKLIS